MTPSKKMPQEKTGDGKSKIYVNGKPLGFAENVEFSTEEPVSDWQPITPATTSVSFDVETAEMSEELIKLFGLEKIMEIQKRLCELMTEIVKLVPTVLFVGVTEDKSGASLMASPEDTSEKRMLDISAAVAMTMERQEPFRELLFSVVSWYMQENPKYQESMQEALDKMKGLKNGHQRTAQPE